MEKITKWALASRLIVIILQFLTNIIFDNHKPDVFRAPIDRPIRNLENVHDGIETTPFDTTWLDKFVQFLFEGLRHWDGEYFLHISEYSYSYENTLAFYPLFPMLVRTCALGLHSLGLGLNLRSWCLLVAICINVFLFCKAANILYTLTQKIFNDTNKSWNATLLFCFNPGSIFFTAAYSETIFCCLTFYVMLECVSEQRFIKTVVTLSLSMVSRSNGILNMAYPAYFLLRKLILKQLNFLNVILKFLGIVLVSLIPLTMFNFYAFQQFCTKNPMKGHSPAVISYARQRNYVLAGQRQPHNSPWCESSYPYFYSYIQSHYWNVGFLRYYEWKQLLNFILATPILVFLAYSSWLYMRNILLPMVQKHRFITSLKELKSFPFVVHCLLLVIFCTLFTHIQISTRLLCSATPCIYWFAADRLPKTIDQIEMGTKGSLILLWFGSYYFIGTGLFANNAPWT